MTQSDAVHDLVEVALDTYEISIDGDLDIEAVDDGSYEVEVPFTGELLLEELVSNYGLLLFNKAERGELSLKAVRDGRLVLTATPASG